MFNLTFIIQIMKKETPIQHIDFQKIEKILQHYKDEVESHLKAKLQEFGKETSLKQACEYALLNGGKRFRPAITLMIAKALGQNLPVIDAALAVEFFHTASLIADDLPCMDNDDERRNKPSLHRAFNESTALLASYALISAGYRAIYQNAVQLGLAEHPRAQDSAKICMLALENATANTGILGATGGQFLDLFPPNHQLDTILEVLDKKTVTLFEVSFILGWLFGGGELDLLEKVKKLAYHWGMAFQIADDMGDAIQDHQQKRPMNLANALGMRPSFQKFNEQILLLQNLLEELGLHSADFQGMIASLVKVAESETVHSS